MKLIWSDFMHLAHQTSAFSLAPRTPISRERVRMIHVRTEITFNTATPSGRERACQSPLRAACTCAAVTCASPCSLVISTQSGCTIWCTNDNESGYQWTWDCLLTPCVAVVIPAANPCGACNSQLRPRPRGKSAHSAAAGITSSALHVRCP